MLNKIKNVKKIKRTKPRNFFIVYTIFYEPSRKAYGVANTIRCMRKLNLTSLRSIEKDLIKHENCLNVVITSVCELDE